jgi:hypothetical protein
MLPKDSPVQGQARTEWRAGQSGPRWLELSFRQTAASKRLGHRLTGSRYSKELHDLCTESVSLWSARGTESLKTLRWREMDSNFQFRVRRAGVLTGLYRRRPSKVFAFPPKRPVSCTRDRWFESVSLQRGVRCELARAASLPSGPRSTGPPELHPHRSLVDIALA